MSLATARQALVTGVVGWSGLFRQRVGEFKVDSATSLNYRPRGLYRNSMSSSSRLLLVPYLCCG